jgi:hypothetical protein
MQNRTKLYNYKKNYDGFFSLFNKKENFILHFIIKFLFFFCTEKRIINNRSAGL